jgi:glyoxalase family protein
MNTSGLHHVTAVSGDAQALVDFYAGVLGLRLVKRTVNFDDPGTYHLYFGDELGRPGSVITFFPWGSHAPRGRAGVGQAVVVSYAAPEDSKEFWRERFAAAGLEHSVTERFGKWTIESADPDGMIVGIVGDFAGGRPGRRDVPVPADMALSGFHAVTLRVRDAAPTARVLEESLGMRLVGTDGSDTRYAPSAEPAHGFVDLEAAPDAPAGRMGAGAIHHVAFRTRDAREQSLARRELIGEGLSVSEVRDRQYFQSIYFVEPGGVLFEIATDGPGFDRDEPVDGLGSSLKLPEWLETHREQIEAALPDIDTREVTVR